MTKIEELYNNPAWRERNADALWQAALDEVLYGYSILQFKENSNDIERIPPPQEHWRWGLDKP